MNSAQRTYGNVFEKPGTRGLVPLTICRDTSALT